MKAILTAALIACSMPSAALTDTAAHAVEQTGLLIDVRTAEEFQSGHLNRAVNLPLEYISADIGRFAADKTTPIRLYCRSGRRAEAALQTLKEMGYTNVRNLGAYEDLKARQTH